MSASSTTPRADRSRRRFALAVLAVFALALGLRLAFWSQLRGGALDEWHRYDQSDMATYLAQADQFASGDWLASEPVHPYHGWQTVAPPEKWLAWYGPHVFHQAPGYAYLLAFARSLSDEPLVLVKAVQLALGACTAVFALLLGAELFGLAVGVIAGVLVASYGPLYYLEAQLLREGPALCALLALAWALARELRIERGDVGRWLACGLLGVAIGLFHVLHEMGTVVLVVAAVVLGLHHLRAELRAERRAERRAELRAELRAGGAAALRALAALLLGYVVGFAPLLGRNLAVGAPPFSVSCRTLINFAQANEANAAEGGATFIAPGPAVVKLLDDADGSFVKLLGGVWATYDGDVAKLVGNWWLRWSAVWKRFEEPDNTSFYFYREYSALLASSPTFALLFPLGIAGLVVAAWGAWATRRASRGGGANVALANPRGVLAACALLLAVAGALSFVHTVARFRLYVTPAFFVGAGFALVSTWSALRARRFGAVGAIVGLASLAALFQGAITRETERDRFRPVDWYVAASVSQALGQHERALAFADDSAKRYTGDVNLYLVLGPTFEAAKRWGEARACYERALAALPQSPDARRGLARVQAAVGGAK
ncbi:MAG: glycosyltransferase family 39 protein [Planctomycetes bacterium]|nr:glycosyltransferase family 39 protein [Planctomycetota bacterium]